MVIPTLSPCTLITCVDGADIFCVVVLTSVHVGIADLVGPSMVPHDSGHQLAVPEGNHRPLPG